MNRNRLQGKGKEAMGGARQAAGNLTTDRQAQARGTTQRTEGKAQGGLGKAMDTLKRLFKR